MKAAEFTKVKPLKQKQRIFLQWYCDTYHMSVYIPEIKLILERGEYLTSDMRKLNNMRSFQLGRYLHSKKWKRKHV